MKQGQHPKVQELISNVVYFIEWLFIPHPTTTHMGAVQKNGAEITREWLLPECTRLQDIFNVPFFN